MNILVGALLAGLILGGTARAQSKISIEQLAAYNKPDREKSYMRAQRQREKSRGIPRWPANRTNSSTPHSKRDIPA